MEGHTEGKILEGAALAAPAPERVELARGVSLGGTRFDAAVLRSLSFADIMAAQEAAEKVVSVKDSLALLASPARLSRELLRRQIARLEGEGGARHEGPLSLEELGRFAPSDWVRVQRALEAREAEEALRLSQAMETRGRDAAGAAWA